MKTLKLSSVNTLPYCHIDYFNMKHLVSYNIVIIL